MVRAILLCYLIGILFITVAYVNVIWARKNTSFKRHNKLERFYTKLSLRVRLKVRLRNEYNVRRINEDNKILNFEVWRSPKNTEAKYTNFSGNWTYYMISSNQQFLRIDRKNLCRTSLSRQYETSSCLLAYRYMEVVSKSYSNYLHTDLFPSTHICIPRLLERKLQLQYKRIIRQINWMKVQRDCAN